MKRGLKTAAICLLAVVVLLIAGVAIAVGVVSSSPKLTSIVNKYAHELMPCPTETGRVELVFFKTFPHVSLKVDDVVVLNPYEGAQSDTLLRAGSLYAGINLRKLLSEERLECDRVEITDVAANIFFDSTGGSNLDIFTSTEEEPTDDEPFENPFRLVELRRVALENADISYIDRQNGMDASANGTSLLLKASADKETATVEEMKLCGQKIIFSSEAQKLDVVLQDIAANLSGKLNSSEADGTLRLSLPHITASMDGTEYAKDIKAEAEIPVKASLQKGEYTLENASLKVGALSLTLNGTAGIAGDDISTDLAFSGKEWKINDILALVPESYASYTKDIEADGTIGFDGTVRGTYSAEEMPRITLSASLTDGSARYDKLLPFPVEGIELHVSAATDLRDEGSATIEILSARTPKSKLQANGTIDNLLADMSYRLNLAADLSLEEFAPFIPDTLPVTIAGMPHIEAQAAFRMSDIEKERYEKILLDGSIEVPSLQAQYDTINASATAAKLKLHLPAGQSSAKEKKFATAELSFGKLLATAGGTAISGDGTELTAGIADFPDLSRHNALSGKFSFGKLQIENDTLRTDISSLKGDFDAQGVFADTTSLPDARVTLSLDALSAQMCDTVSLDMRNVSLSAQDIVSGDRTRPQIKIEFSQGAMTAAMGGQSLTTGKTGIKADLQGDLSQKELLLQWTPSGFVSLENAVARLNAVPGQIKIPEIDFVFTPEEYKINRSSVELGQSDFELSGTLHNVNSYLHSDSLLRAELKFVSGVTDVNYFMNLFSGMGDVSSGGDVEYAPDEIVVAPQLSKLNDTTTDTTQTSSATDTENGVAESSGPFMVPKGISVVLDTRIDNALIGTNVARNVNGTVTVDDGVLVLDNLNFTSSAADVQLTAMYKSPRRNHLYVGLDYHMLNVEIGDLLSTFPDLGEMMPMLNSFGGTGEFHMAVETNLDSLYNLKKSTLRGAASIYGKDLVLMDGETFSTIARKLHFKKDAENRIDSLSAEFTVFRNEIDIYPFLIVMDRYKAIVGGRHNLDMSLNYNISMIQNPLVPIRLGVDVFGTPENLKFRLRRCRYDADYRPVGRKSLAAEQINLRNMIYNSLSSGVIRAGATIETEEPLE